MSGYEYVSPGRYGEARPGGLRQDFQDLPGSFYDTENYGRATYPSRSGMESPGTREIHRQERMSFPATDWMMPGTYHTGGVVGSTPVGHRLFDPRIFVGAPRFQEGLGPDEYPAVLHAGETVTPAGGRTRGAPIIVNTPPQPPSIVNVTVNNNAGADVKVNQGKDEQGNVRLDIVIDEMVAGKMRDGGSRIARTMAGMGARAQPIRR